MSYKYVLISLTLLIISLNTQSREYDVSGSGDGGYVSGTIDTSSGSKYVDGYLQLEDGSQVSFDGEFVGRGVVEGTDSNGNYYELEVE